MLHVRFFPYTAYKSLSLSKHLKMSAFLSTICVHLVWKPHERPNLMNYSTMKNKQENYWIIHKKNNFFSSFHVINSFFRALPPVRLESDPHGLTSQLKMSRGKMESSLSENSLFDRGRERERERKIFLTTRSPRAYF